MFLTAALGAIVEKLGLAIFILSQIDVAFRAGIVTRVHVILVTRHKFEGYSSQLCEQLLPEVAFPDDPLPLMIVE
jgi:hypothetical protein